MNFNALGKRIRQQRKLLDMTQEELGMAAGVSTSYIGHIERAIKCCSLETLVDIANALNISPNILLQDSLRPELQESELGLSATTRSMLNDIANVLREYDTKTSYH